MSRRKFISGDQVVGREEAPASYRNRTGAITDFRGHGGYGVSFEDTETEYLNSNWRSLCTSLESYWGLEEEHND